MSKDTLSEAVETLRKVKKGLESGDRSGKQLAGELDRVIRDLEQVERDEPEPE